MLDLTQPVGEAAGYINKISIKRDGTSNNGLLFDLDLSFMLPSGKEAKIIDKIIPGALAMYHRIDEGDEQLKTNVRVVPSAQDLFATLKYSEETLELFNGRCCVKTIIYNAVPSASSIIFRIRFFEVNVTSAGSLCESLGSKIIFGFTKQQQLLSFPAPQIEVENSEPWTIISGMDEEGEWVFGRLIHTNNSNQNNSSTILINDFGEETIIEESGIVSRFDISASGQLPSMMDTFKNKVEKIGRVPTWECMILAIGQEYSNNTRSESNVFELAWEVINIAVQYSKSAS